jgi:SAM-dependent methyltransferase
LTDKPATKKELFAAIEAPEVLRRDPTVVVKACALCGGRDARRRYMQAHFPVVQCRGCGLIYADEHFREEDLEAFYSGDYYQRAYVCHPAEIDRKVAADYVRAFERVHRKLPEGGRLLDFGSARGTFLTELEQRGYGAQWRMEGVDINPDEIEMGRSRGLDLRCGTLESQGYGPGTFDAVAAFSVLEHLQDPVATLGEIARVTRRGGRLLLIVPSGRCLIISLALLANRLLGHRARSFTDNVFHEEHIYYFTPETLTRLLEEVGFGVEEVFYTPSYLETHPPSVLVGVGSGILRFASWALRRQTMLGVVALRS